MSFIQSTFLTISFVIATATPIVTDTALFFPLSHTLAHKAWCMWFLCFCSDLSIFQSAVTRMYVHTNVSFSFRTRTIKNRVILFLIVVFQVYISGNQKKNKQTTKQKQTAQLKCIIGISNVKFFFSLLPLQIGIVTMRQCRTWLKMNIFLFVANVCAEIKRKRQNNLIPLSKRHWSGCRPKYSSECEENRRRTNRTLTQDSHLLIELHMWKIQQTLSKQSGYELSDKWTYTYQKVTIGIRNQLEGSWFARSWYLQSFLL